ncbi:MAG TPA: hypothetical protein PLQ97_11775 [Myxococcota bacterium]|nr:hypothetical protein [Myxococcota bacterium]HQK51438.1 hypothetical protein [Myxococcota bacterium]
MTPDDPLHPRTQATPSSPRLALVELVYDLRFRTDQAWYFPFLAALADRLGASCRWWCVGGTCQARVTGGEGDHYVVTPDDKDTEALEAALAAVAPTHLLVSEVPGDSLAVALRRAAPGARCLTSAPAAGPGWPTLFDQVASGPESPARPPLDQADRVTRVDWFARWLDRPLPGDVSPGSRLADAVVPRYDACMVGDRSRALAPLIQVVAGVRCDHARPVADNPCYAGIDLSGASRRGGCTFCSYQVPPRIDPRGDPVRQALDQVAAIRRTALPEGRDCGHYEFQDVRLLNRLEPLVTGLLAMDLPPSTFYLHPRIDAVLAQAEALPRVLSRLRPAGHVLWLFRVGLESFSEVENARFNKGISRRQIDDFLSLMADLESRFPGTLVVSRPYGYIAWTPWTRPADIREGLQAHRARGMGEDGTWLANALQMYSDAPIAALAAADGLLIDHFEDPALAFSTALEGAVRPGMRAWRFQDPRTALLAGAVIRVLAVRWQADGPGGPLFGDADVAWIRERAAEGLAPGDPMDVATRAIEVLEGADPPTTTRELLARCLLPGRTAGIATRAASPDPRLAKARRAIQAMLDLARTQGHPVLSEVRLAGLGPASPGTISLRIEVAGHPLDLRIRDASTGGPCFARTPRLLVSHASETPLRDSRDVEVVRGITDLLARLEAAGLDLVAMASPSPVRPRD